MQFFDEGREEADAAILEGQDGIDGDSLALQFFDEGREEEIGLAVAGVSAEPLIDGSPQFVGRLGPDHPLIYCTLIRHIEGI